jgi:hypothetical protein
VPRLSQSEKRILHFAQIDDFSTFSIQLGGDLRPGRCQATLTLLALSETRLEAYSSPSSQIPDCAGYYICTQSICQISSTLSFGLRWSKVVAGVREFHELVGEGFGSRNVAQVARDDDRPASRGMCNDVDRVVFL